MQSLKGGGRVHVGDVVCGGITMVERDCVCGALKVEVTRVHELCAIVMVGGFLTRSREPRVRFKTRGSKAGLEPKPLVRVLTGASTASSEEQ